MAESLSDEISTLAPELVFVGSSHNFSPMLMAATKNGLGDIVSIGIPNFASFRAALPSLTRHMTVVVLDEPTVKALTESDWKSLCSFQNVSIAVAYSTHDFGVECYRDPRLRSRAVSIFALNVRIDVWLSIVSLVCRGGVFICPSVVGTIAGSGAGSGARDAESAPVQVDDPLLTPRQQDVLRLVADGQSNKRIAATLGLSEHTVKLHLHNANQRLGVSNRTEAAMRFRGIGP